MSNILKDQQPILVTDSRLIKKSVPRPILRGASSILYKQWDAVSSTAGGINFSCQTPFPNAEIDRCIQVLCPVRAVVTAVWTSAQNGQYLAEPQKIGIRSYPIQKALDRLELRMNNHAFSINIGEIMSGIEHFNTSRKLKLLEYSKCATYGTCQSQTFDDIRSGIRSGLAPYVSSISGIAPQNFPFTVYANTAASSGNSYTATATIDFVSVEPLFISPCYWGDSEENFEAFAGISTIDVNLQFRNNNPQFRMIAIQNTNSVLNTDRGGTITGSLQVNFVASDSFSYSDLKPKLLINYLKPQCPLSLDKPLLYPYYNIDVHKARASSAMSTFTNTIVSTQSILLTKLPSKIYVWARKPDSTFEADPFTPDAFCSIENLRLLWNGRIVLSEAHKAQLYDMSVKNGLQLEYATWSGYRLNNEEPASSGFGTSAQQFGGTGSLVCIDPMDLGLDSQITHDPNSQIELQIDATLQNISGASFTPDLYVLVLTDGVMKIHQGIVSTFVGIADTRLDPSKDCVVQVAKAQRSGSYDGGYKIDVPSLIKSSLDRSTGDKRSDVNRFQQKNLNY